MKKVIYPIFACAILISSLAFTVSSVEYKISDSHSIAFKSKDPSGSFKEMKGTIKFDEGDLDGSKFDLTIAVSSINTGNGMMQKKAQTEEWFHASKYPNVTFSSTKIEKSGDSYKITGNFKMKGVSKSLTIPMSVDKSGSNLTFTGKFKINRMDFKVGKKSDAVPDVMEVVYSIPTTKK
jgi:polyisoprenoid-binding protein YceI